MMEKNVKGEEKDVTIRYNKKINKGICKWKV
jgi:hypothetical protein